MDAAQRLMDVVSARSTASVTSKLDALLNLERLEDARVMPFLLRVLADRRQEVEVRIHLLKLLRNGDRTHGYRRGVADTMLQILVDQASPDLRVHAALALAEFTDIDDVPVRLGGLLLDPCEPIDLRYSAFTSLQRAGPTPVCLELLQQLSTDEMLGRSARNLISSWRFK